MGALKSPDFLKRIRKKEPSTGLERPRPAAQKQNLPWKRKNETEYSHCQNENNPSDSHSIDRPIGDCEVESQSKNGETQGKRTDDVSNLVENGQKPLAVRNGNPQYVAGLIPLAGTAVKNEPLRPEQTASSRLNQSAIPTDSYLEDIHPERVERLSEKGFSGYNWTRSDGQCNSQSRTSVATGIYCPDRLSAALSLPCPGFS